MKEDYVLINIILYAIYALYSNKGVVYDGITSKLEHLIQKSIRYQHHHLNYKGSLENVLIPNGLNIKKSRLSNQFLKTFSKNGTLYYSLPGRT